MPKNKLYPTERCPFQSLTGGTFATLILMAVTFNFLTRDAVQLFLKFTFYVTIRWRCSSGTRHGRESLFIRYAGKWRVVYWRPKESFKGVFRERRYAFWYMLATYKKYLYYRHRCKEQKSFLKFPGYNTLVKVIVLYKNWQICFISMMYCRYVLSAWCTAIKVEYVDRYRLWLAGVRLWRTWFRKTSVQSRVST